MWITFVPHTTVWRVNESWTSSSPHTVSLWAIA